MSSCIEKELRLQRLSAVFTKAVQVKTAPFANELGLNIIIILSVVISILGTRQWNCKFSFHSRGLLSNNRKNVVGSTGQM